MHEYAFALYEQLLVVGGNSSLLSKLFLQTLDQCISSKDLPREYVHVFHDTQPILHPFRLLSCAYGVTPESDIIMSIKHQVSVLSLYRPCPIVKYLPELNAVVSSDEMKKYTYDYMVVAMGCSQSFYSIQGAYAALEDPQLEVHTLGELSTLGRLASSIAYLSQSSTDSEGPLRKLAKEGGRICFAVHSRSPPELGVLYAEAAMMFKRRVLQKRDKSFSEKCEVTLYTGLSSLHPSPAVNQIVSQALHDAGINTAYNADIKAVHADKHECITTNNGSFQFDLLVLSGESIPPHAVTQADFHNSSNVFAIGGGYSHPRCLMLTDQILSAVQHVSQALHAPLCHLVISHLMYLSQYS